MNILLTGAAGFTGLHFITQAELAGHAVTSLEADLRDASAVFAAVNSASFDAVLHLGAISFVGHANTADFYSVNVVGTTNLLEALASRDRGLTCVLLASSANIYGNCDASPITETQPPAPMNHYAASKLAMEHLARTFSDRLTIAIARPFNYTGLGQTCDLLIPKIVDHFARSAPLIELGNLFIEREFNDVRVVCEAYLRILSQGAGHDTFNICSGQTYTLGQVITTLEEKSGHRIRIASNPAFQRPNEVHRLCGSPQKFIDRFGTLSVIPLSSTLGWMLGGGSSTIVPMPGQCS